MAQLGGVHLACEQASNVLTKVLEWGRLMAYLEQSTRYIAYDHRLTTGHYRYYRDPAVLDSPLGARYVGEMDRMFDTYGELLVEAQAWLTRRHPRQPGDSDFVHRQAVRAKALDALRGLLPAASLSNVGIYGTGQSYEMLLLRMRSHPLPEARRYADLMLEELRKVIPLVPPAGGPARPGRRVVGATWTATRRGTAATGGGALPRPGGAGRAPAPAGRPGRPSVTLVDFDPEGEDKVIAAICAPLTGRSEEEVLAPGRRLGAEERAGAAAGLRGRPGQPPPPPGPGLRAHRLPLRRGHRLRRLPGPAAPPDADHRVAAARYRPWATTFPTWSRRPGSATGTWRRWSGRASSTRRWRRPSRCESAYAVALAFRIRYSMQMNAREAMHLPRAALGPAGPPVLPVGGPGDAPPHRRAGRPPADGRGHVHVDYGAQDLERLESERRAEERRNSLSAASEIPYTALTREVGRTLLVTRGECRLTSRGADGVSFAQSQTPRGARRAVSDRRVGSRGGCCERRREAQGIE